MTTTPPTALGWDSCAARSRELGEDLAGSAAVATGWVCVEHAGPWSPRAPTAFELGDAAAALAGDGVRVQLVRRPGRPPPSDGRTTVLLGHAAVSPRDRWLRRVVVDGPSSLAEIVDPAVTSSPSPPEIGDPVDGDVWLVCTHGRRDACCAVHGRPVAAALAAAGHEVWETTHTGGHRFAATAVLLPDGLALGRLDTVPPDPLARRLADGVLPPDLLRGRCAVPGPVQAAEARARAELGVRARDGLLPTAWTTAGDRTTVSLAGADTAWRATVVTRPATFPRPISDGAAPTTPVEHDLVALAAESPD